MKENKLSIQSSIIWNSTGSLIYLCTQWLISVLVVRIAGVETAGNFTLAMSVNNVFYSIATQGIRNYQVSDIKEKYSNGTYVGSRLIACIITVIICVGYCVIIQYSDGQKACIIAYCLFKISEAIYDVYAGICQKAWRMDYIGKSWIIKGIVTFAVFCGVLYISSDLFIAIIAMALSSYGVVFLYDIPKAKSLAHITINLRTKDNLLLMAECMPLLCYLILSTLISTIPRIFMERILGSYELGIYGSIATPTLIVQVGASYIFNPFLTLFAEKYNCGEIDSFWKTLKKCFLSITVLSVIALLGGRILGKWGLTILYGAEIAQYVYLLVPLIFCTILTAIVWFLCALLTVVREFRGLIIGNVMGTILSCVSSAVLLKIAGMQGASIALSVSLVAEIIFLWIYLKRKLKKIER
ncbi:lipopolysaccharide biosynthesis protein [Lachnoclostridium phocaeense]|uniref:lipopolysaccharide biosynthesis protein n=1 Tax=Lachnoclostridium phocaeense TaxID=1871021 RepID=UPI00248E3056|nr:lipopolysaccharide biosynthesis protein [Lachnoclostridium phocaeense]